ncbi:MAG: DMT family transporter [Hyphomicrobiales bacterium]
MVTPPHPVTANNSSHSAGVRAIILMVIAVASFGFLDAVGKHLSGSLPVMQVVWMRFVTHVLLCLFIFRLWSNYGRLRTSRPLLQGARGLFMLGTTIFNFWALQYLQLAETASIMFAGPIVVAALAGPLLGEWAGPRRWAAIGIGFIGVLVVTRPGLSGFGVDGLGWPALVSVGSMVSFALYSLSTRVLAQTENIEGLVVLTALVPVVALAPFAISVWVWPTDLLSWVLMLIMGILGGGGHWLLIIAHRHATAPTLAPFMYSQIIWMIALGWLVFADIPTIWTLTGASIIIASGLYLLYRETRAKQNSSTSQETIS